MIKPSFALALAMVSISPATVAAEEAVTPPISVPAAEAAPDLSELDHAIPYGESLLEKKDYETFFKTFVNPKLQEQMMEGRSFADVAKNMEGQNGQNLLFAFKALKDIKPVIEEDGNKATYKFPYELVKEHQFRNTEMVFERIDKHWYIKR